MTTPRPRGVPLPLNRWDLLTDRLALPLPPVSVIVVHFEQQRQLDRTLLALGRQTYPDELLQIIVVDDGSRQAPQVPPNVTLIRQRDEGFRVAAARNRGAEVASGEILLFLDADTAPEPEYVAELSRLPAIAPDCVTVGRRRHARFDDVAPEEGVHEAGQKNELTEPAWLIEAYRRSDDLLAADDRSYRFMIGAVTACNRTIFDAAGGFDESFTEYGGEDWEWADRAWLAGAVFAHVRSAVAWHDGPEWSERPELENSRRKNLETMRLSTLVNAPGAAPRGIRQGPPAVAIGLADSAASVAQEFVTIDSALAEIPLARIVGGRYATDPAAATGRTRFRVTIHRGCQIGVGALREAIAEVAAEALGTLTLTDRDDSPLLTVSSVRAEAREERWGEPLFSARRRVEERIRTIPPEPDLERYLGGW